jgi:hypothetical protein
MEHMDYTWIVRGLKVFHNSKCMILWTKELEDDLNRTKAKEEDLKKTNEVEYGLK